VWAGGMGGGMMGNGGHMMDSFGYGQMGSGRYNDRNSSQQWREERQRAQETYDHDMQRLDRQIRDKEQALDAEMQKKSPDKAKIEKLRHDLSELEHRYDDRRAEFESRWGQDEQR
jgi:predicted  nucleic acid-binding Zn-ribbon protein